MPSGEIEMDLPFDNRELDRLMEEHDFDALVVTSKHNIRYLTGGYAFFFFGFMDAIGVSRYLPVLVYRRGAPDQAFYAGNPMEGYERDLGKFWMPNLALKTWGTLSPIGEALAHIAKIGGCRKIGVEMPFIPADAQAALAEGLANCAIADCGEVLERLRAVKTGPEMSLLEEASNRVVDSMLAAMKAHGVGSTKQAIADTLKREEQARGLDFEYCLVTAGSSNNRAPSAQVIAAGDPASIDSGGNYQGYIGDLCRMAVAGEPDRELVDLLGEIEEVQQAARQPVRAGALGAEIFEAGAAALARQPNRERTHFTAHGMGLISHEAPRLDPKGPVPYPAVDYERPLRAGYILSIETTMPHPRRGFIKLEDTVAVTETGWRAFGDHGRGWNRFGC
jgi:Xaa-Pro aminopeptidase